MGTRSALRNRDEFAGFIAKDNPTRATSFVMELKEAVTKLQVHTGLSRAGRVPGSRELVLHKNYVAIYRMRAEDAEIMRLHHVAQNLS